jgi:hypothetical protein
LSLRFDCLLRVFRRVRLGEQGPASCSSIFTVETTVTAAIDERVDICLSRPLSIVVSARANLQKQFERFVTHIYLSIHHD